MYLPYYGPYVYQCFAEAGLILPSWIIQLDFQNKIQYSSSELRSFRRKSPKQRFPTNLWGSRVVILVFENLFVANVLVGINSMRNKISHNDHVATESLVLVTGLPDLATVPVPPRMSLL